MIRVIYVCYAFECRTKRYEHALYITRGFLSLSFFFIFLPHSSCMSHFILLFTFCGREIRILVSKSHLRNYTPQKEFVRKELLFSVSVSC